MCRNAKIFMLLGYVKARIEDLTERHQEKAESFDNFMASLADFESYYNKTLTEILDGQEDCE
jgi:hypothetical protein